MKRKPFIKVLSPNSAEIKSGLLPVQRKWNASVLRVIKEFVKSLRNKSF